jgi:hypothetical protein
MCFWSEMAFFHCDGTVQREKHLCKLVPNDGHGAGVEICKNYETPSGCKHSDTTRAIPHRAIYRHVCHKDAYRPPAGTGIRPKWTPLIKEPFSVYMTGRSADDGELKNSVQFRWCDGSLCSVEDVFGRNAGDFNCGGVDLLKLEEQDVCRLVGKGTYEHWVGLWSGNAER